MTINYSCDKGLRPPLKWAGGKRWLLPSLVTLWEPFRDHRLVEPFCGGAAVTMGLQPDKALLNDINEHLVNFFRWIQKGLLVTLSMENDEAIYYKHRDCFNSLVEECGADTREAAGLFYYLNRTGYNGLCRFNQKGQFNVPFGRYKKINYVYDFRCYQDIVKNWNFVCTDFEELVLNNDDFIYADPPYDVEFTSYTKEGFNWDEQLRLAKWLSTHSGPVVLSNQATDRITELYSDYGYKLIFFDAPRRISCNGSRTPAREVLALKNVNYKGTFLSTK